MATKKVNIEELEQQFFEAEKTYRFLYEQLEKAKKEEEDAKKEKLKAEKQKRYDAVVDAYNKFEKLRIAYVDDYGYFTFESTDKKGDSHSWFWKTIGLM